MTLKAFWPQLFDGNAPRLLATGMREQLFADIVNRDLPLSHKQVIKCLKSLTRSAGYLSRMKAGVSRYDLQGNAVATVTAEEAQYASERMMKELLRTERMTVVAAGDKHSPAAVCSALAGFCRNDRLFLPWIWAVDVLDGVAGPGDASPVRLRNQSYRGRVIWPDDGTFSSVAAKGE